MSESVLNRLEVLLREGRERGDVTPRDPARKVFVDPSGRIRVGDAVHRDDRPGLSEIHQGTFATPGA
jgi:hypothetical protein